MSEPKTKKFVTFGDLRDINRKAEAKLRLVDTSKPPADTPDSLPVTPANQEESALPPKQTAPSPLPKNQENIPSERPLLSVSPRADFQKVPNSIIREALPEGLFRGKSKQVWDYLWSVSRGAINPTRLIRCSRREIKEGSGLGSMVTVDAALTHLTKVGLLQISPSVGSLLGNQYEIFAPEEVAEIASTYTTYTSTPRYTSLTQKLDILDILVSGISSITQGVDSKGGLPISKTSLKTTGTDDDDTHTDALQPLLQEIAKVVCVLQSGMGNTEQEKAAWRKVGNILGTELQKIAERAGDVTSLPALLAEHLKRKLHNPPVKPVPQKPSAPPPPPETLAVKPTAAKKTTPRPAPDKSKNPAGKNARPGSTHSFAECLRYAEHLQASGQGIHNPGGLAQSLYRSGTADALISHFLEWETKKTKVVGQDQPAAPPARMSADEIAGQISVVYDLIAQKVVADISEMEEKFGSYLHPADWQVIHAGVRQRLDGETAHA